MAIYGHFIDSRKKPSAAIADGPDKYECWLSLADIHAVVGCFSAYTGY